MQRKQTRPQYLKSQRFDRNQHNAYSRNLNVHIIETEQATDSAMKRITKVDCVGFDCEGIVTLGRSGKLSLIQICTQQSIYLFDIYKMDYKIPQSLKEWLSSNHCTKYIHDSRQDQDALYHCHGVALEGIFDTTIANLIYRVWIGKNRGVNRLKGMDALAHDTIHRAQDYKILLSIKSQQTGKYINLDDIKKEQDTNGAESAVIPAAQNNANTGKQSWKKIKVNCFDQKQNIKALMRADAYLWQKRPMPINLVIYAAVDGYISLLMGQFFKKKFKQWLLDKTLFVSAKWCRMVARQTRVRKSSSKVPNSIVKLIRSNTDCMNMDDIPSIDRKFKCKKERMEAKELEMNKDISTEDIQFEDLVLMETNFSFLARKTNAKINPNEKSHEKGVMEHVTDIFKLDYDERERDYIKVGKLNYSRLIPLTLINSEKNNF